MMDYKAYKEYGSDDWRDCQADYYQYVIDRTNRYNAAISKTVDELTGKCMAHIIRGYDTPIHDPDFDFEEAPHG